MPYLLVRSHGFAEVSQEVVCVAEVTVGSPLSGAVPQLLHDTQICPADTNDGQTLLRLEKHSRETPLRRAGRSLVVLGRLPQRRHDLLGEISRFGAAPADAFAFGVVHITKVIQRSSLTHLTRTQGESAAVRDLFPHRGTLRFSPYR